MEGREEGRKEGREEGREEGWKEDMYVGFFGAWLFEGVDLGGWIWVVAIGWVVWLDGWIWMDGWMDEWMNE